MVDLISITPDIERTITYIARTSNPANQRSEKIENLLQYCIKHGHWSPFEHGFMTVEINTTRAISPQILRHRSFFFQEFSQRYADVNALETDLNTPDMRIQDKKNRQNSIETNSDYSHIDARIQLHFKESMAIYNNMIEEGIAKECARFVLPLATPTRLYMSGTIRSWIHYIQLRTGNGTQREHMDIANECKRIFVKQLPIVSSALGWE